MEASCFALTFGHTVPALSRPCACETVRYKSDISHFASLSRCYSPVVSPHFLLLIVQSWLRADGLNNGLVQRGDTTGE